MIDAAFQSLYFLLDTHANIDTVFFSVDKDEKIGTGIFTVGEEVRTYITDKINRLPKRDWVQDYADASELLPNRMRRIRESSNSLTE